MQTIYIDIANKSVLPTIYAKQGEVGRKFEVVLTDSGVPYNVESGVLFSVWYEGASGEGNYTDIGENSAFTISGNRVVVELITQMLVNPGCGTVCLVMNKGANQIGVWNIPYICEQVPGFDSEESEGYYTAFSKAVEKISSPDPTLSVVGAPAEAKSTGDALAERAFAKRTVNGYQLTEDINLNASDVGAAPAGYGYGGKITTKIYNTNGTEADFNAMLENVFASMSDETAMQVQFLDASTGYSFIYTATLYKSYSDYGWLKGTDYGGRNLQKIKREGTWQPWEYINPPMAPGVEYRTTERWNGKPVWKSLTKITGLPNTAYGMYNLAASFCERMVGKHISYERTDGADFLEYVEAGEIYFGNYSTPYIVFNKTKADLSTMTAYVTLFYTKTTD